MASYRSIAALGLALAALGAASGGVSLWSVVASGALLGATTLPTDAAGEFDGAVLVYKDVTDLVTDGTVNTMPAPGASRLPQIS